MFNHINMKSQIAYKFILTRNVRGKFFAVSWSHDFSFNFQMHFLSHCPAMNYIKLCMTSSNPRYSISKQISSNM